MKVLILAADCGEDRGGAPLRVHNWIQMMKPSAEVVFYPTAKKAAEKETLFTKIKRFWTYYKPEFTPLELKEKPDIVQIHNPYFWGLQKQFPKVPKILVEHNVHWNLLKYDIDSSPALKKLPLKSLWKPWFLWRAEAFEKKAIAEASHIFVCSENDKQEIVKKLPGAASKITVLPNCVDLSRYSATPEPGEFLLFMGPLSYSANVDAVEIICKELAPRLPHLPFKILGKGNYGKALPANVEFMGFVEDVRPYLQKARLFIVPLRMGSGTRWKILEAFACARPVLSTSKGAEGLEVTHKKNIWIEDDWEKFAQAIERFWNHPEEALQLGREGRKLVEEKYDYKKYQSTVLKVYQDAIQKN